MAARRGDATRPSSDRLEPSGRVPRAVRDARVDVGAEVAFGDEERDAAVAGAPLLRRPGLDLRLAERLAVLGLGVRAWTSARDAAVPLATPVCASAQRTSADAPA
jgi:hypothetical protein